MLQTTEKKPEFRAVTLVGNASLTIVLPRHFASALEVERGDYVKIVQDGRRLIVEKAN